MRSYGRFTTTIWRDQDFTTLSQPLQGLYFMLATQPDVTAAGTLAVTAGRWAKLSDGLTRREVEEQLVALQAHAGRHIVMDDDTEELIIRTFIKWDDGWKNSKRLPVIFDAIRAIASVHIRDIAVDELRKIGAGISHTATEQQARDAVSRKVEEFVSSIDRKRLRVTEGESEPFPQTPNPEPGAVALAAVAAPPHDPYRCEEHQGIAEPGNCGKCKDARLAEEARKRAQVEDEVAVKRARAEAIAACRLCDENGKRTKNGVIIARFCDHVPDVTQLSPAGGAS